MGAIGAPTVVGAIRAPTVVGASRLRVNEYLYYVIGAWGGVVVQALRY